MKMYKKKLKRILSIILSAILIIILLPVYFLLYCIIKVNLGSPVFFRQYRPGKNEKIFQLIKFRTMTDKKDINGILLPDNKRINKLGLFLRKSSLDELPELLNILKGDMAFIGPRPLSIHYLSSYDDRSRVRGEVRPGLTGLAQIRGRNRASWDERLQNDIYYVENISLLLDIKIFFSTVMKVILQDGVQVRKKTDEIKNFNTYTVVKEQSKVMGSKEIGSYFEESLSNELCKEKSIYDFLLNRKYKDFTFTISGRSAIELALKNILKEKKIKKAFLPSYSCISMTQPFLDNDIEVEYYEVSIDSSDGFEMFFDVNKLNENNIFLFMDYFGIQKKSIELDRILHSVKINGGVIIEDITHSIFSKHEINPNIDYQICSIRKWLAVASGGLLYSCKEDIIFKPTRVPNEKINKKVDAMKNKKKYLSGQTQDKENFLIGNAAFDNALIRLNCENTLDDYSLKVLKQTSLKEFCYIRNRNASYLVQNIDTKSKVYFPFSCISATDIPLFIPIIIDAKIRDNLRKKFIEEGIYLPVHWPEKISEVNTINTIELSLVCDQRYNLSDMRRIVDIINNYK